MTVEITTTSAPFVDARRGRGTAFQRTGAPGSTALTAKRGLDVAAATVALIVLFPVMTVIAVIVGISSRGPVLFRQQRVGRHGELFELVKFRTMRDGTHAQVLSDEIDRQRYIDNDFKLDPDDPRITRVGSFLRRTSLDELPQLFNVLRGEMSLVGVRPLLDIEMARRSIADQERYCSLPPGVTGLWQVEGRSRVVHEHRFALDRRYVDEWSLRNDVKLLARTPAAVLRTHHTR